MQTPDVSVILPVYNGAAFLEESICALDGYLKDHFDKYEMIVVDDGSTDHTKSIFSKLAHLPNLKTIHVPDNEGKFAAIRRGIAASRGRCQIFTDADLPYDLEAIGYIDDLINRRKFHIVIGDRTLSESQYSENYGLIRTIASRIFTILVTVIVTGSLRDTQCGIKGFRHDVAEGLFSVLRDPGFSGDVELLYIAIKYNLEIKRIPVRLQRNEESTVKLLKHALSMIYRISKLKLYWRKGYYKSQDLELLSRQEYWK